MSPIKSFLNQGPAATVLIVLLVLAAGVVSLVDPDEIDFKQWWTISTAVGAALAVGRGFAAKGDVSTSTNGFEDLFNKVPWATVIVYTQAIFGFVVVVTTDSLTYDEYFMLILPAGAVTALGRGIGTYKIDRDPVLRGNNDPNFQNAIAAEQGAIAAGLGDEPPEGAVEGKPGLQ